METVARVPSRVAMIGVLALAAVAVASCAPATVAPTEARAEAPTVSYRYTEDRQLVDATEQARMYCRRYSSWPSAGQIRDLADGSHSVVFACDRPMPPVTALSVPMLPRVSYDYRTDQGLIQATNKAQDYCRSYDVGPVLERIETQLSGAKTVTFRCGAVGPAEAVQVPAR